MALDCTIEYIIIYNISIIYYIDQLDMNGKTLFHKGGYCKYPVYTSERMSQLRVRLEPRTKEVKLSITIYCILSCHIYNIVSNERHRKQGFIDVSDLIYISIDTYAV